MIPQRILLIGNGLRSQQLTTIFQFMEFEVEVLRPHEFESGACDFERFMAVFLDTDAELNDVSLNRLRERSSQISIVLVADKGGVESFQSSYRDLTDLSVEWPVTYPLMSELLARINRKESARSEPRNVELFRSLAGHSPAIMRTRKLIQQVANSDATVLILGESGTGKEVIARNLHYYSSRKMKPFVPVNCGAIPGELLESELFGHEKGAFTGALSSRQGRFELADGGTLFLDEIGDMPLSMQIKLLRVLQERSFERVGSNRTMHCDVRIIAATHRNLEDEIRLTRFREDLFYRLNVFPIEVPALRERLSDIPVLVQDLSARMRAEKRASVQLTPAAYKLMKRHHWPGNVRELANLIERLAILYPHATVDAPDLPEKFQQYATPDEAGPERQSLDSGLAPVGTAATYSTSARLPREGLDLKEHLNSLECELIRRALDECNGVVAHAAILLKMRRTTLVEKLRKYGLQRSEELSNY
jgi:sigma-54 specific flagellar transcriptional regulator A